MFFENSIEKGNFFFSIADDLLTDMKKCVMFYETARWKIRGQKEKNSYELLLLLLWIFFRWDVTYFLIEFLLNESVFA